MRYARARTETHAVVWWRNLTERICEPLRGGCENNIEINVTETGWEKIDWIHPAPDRNKWSAVVRLRIPVNVKKSSEEWRNKGFTNPGRINFVSWHPIFVGAQYGTCFLSPFWRPEFLTRNLDLQDLWTRVANYKLLNKDSAPWNSVST